MTVSASPSWSELALEYNKSPTNTNLSDFYRAAYYTADAKRVTGSMATVSTGGAISASGLRYTFSGHYTTGTVSFTNNVVGPGTYAYGQGSSYGSLSNSIAMLQDITANPSTSTPGFGGSYFIYPEIYVFWTVWNGSQFNTTLTLVGNYQTGSYGAFWNYIMSSQNGNVLSRSTAVETYSLDFKQNPPEITYWTWYNTNYLTAPGTSNLYLYRTYPTNFGYA